MTRRGFTVNKRWENSAERVAPAGARVPSELRIGAVMVRPATVLAPMAGVTDTVFRRFIRHASLFTREQGTGNRNQGTGPNGQWSVVGGQEAVGVESPVTNDESGCGLLMTEFTSADGLSRMRESKRRRYLTFYDDEHPIGAQLFGSNPATMAEAARIVEQTGFDLVDLNLGCPAKRVVGSNGGSGLLRDLPRIGEIFRAVRGAVTIPFTVKFRMGWNDREIVCEELARMAEAEGLDAVALHARTREQGYGGQAQWQWIARVREAVGIPVIGNGDVRTPEDAAAMVAETGCHGVMIGRAASANPWIFRQIAQYTATGSYDRPTEADRYRMIRAYFEMLLAESGVPTNRSSSVGWKSGVLTDRSSSVGWEAEANQDPGCESAAAAERSSPAGWDPAGKMKQFASWFTHGVAGGAKLRAAIYQARTGEAVFDEVERFFSSRSAEELAAEVAIERIAPAMTDSAEVCD